MSTLDFDAIKKSLLLKTNDQLLDILSFNQDDYNLEVIPIIKQILIERECDKSLIDRAEVYYETIANHNKSPKEKQESFSKKLIKWVVLAVVLSLLGKATVYFTQEKTNNETIPKKTLSNEPYWSDKAKQELKTGLSQREDLRILKPKARSYFIDCYIKELSIRYPNGISNPISEKETLEIGKICTDSLIIHQKELIE